MERMARMAASRMRWYCLSVSVCCGATVTESPVWTPIGSTFSMEQTMMTLSLASRRSSSSYSFQPNRHSSIRTWWTGLISRPRVTLRSNASALQTMPPPVPPSVYEGRMTIGMPPSSCVISLASRRLLAVRLAAWSRPTSSIRSRKSCRSSVRSTASMLTPMTSQPASSQKPSSCSVCARLRPVCPPIVGSTASGRSARTMRLREAGVSSRR